MKRHVLGATVAGLFVLMLVALGEGVVRWLDGYSLLHLTLTATPARAGVVPVVARDTIDSRYFDTITLAPGVDAVWYPIDPPSHTPIPMTPVMAARAERYKDTDPLGAFFAWNPAYLKLQLCGGLRFGSLGVLDDFYTFEPPPQSGFPIYRHLSSMSPPGWFPTNRFGWRGPDVTLNKPPRTIRVAFAGSSMTIDPYHVPFSHIEYIGEWLNQWTRARGYPFKVEVLNVARTGIDSSSVAAAVIQELMPLEPDLVIFDGSNDYRPGLMLSLPKEGLPPTPPGFGLSGPQWTAERYSAVARRIRVVVETRREGTEPLKPSFPIVWPPEVNERNPDVAQRPLPMGLHDVMTNFDTMRTAIAASGGQFVLTSVVAMVYDNLKLALPRDWTLFKSINDATFPITYAQNRRLLDFQNRAFQNYATLHDLPFIDKAAVLPLDPELFIDMVHMLPPGNRLQSWMYLQWIVRWIDQEVAAGRLPRPMQHPLNAHPAFPTKGYSLVTKASILASCQ